MSVENHPVRLFLTTPHACQYLPQRTARTLVVDPQLEKDSELYSALLNIGFRRSGTDFYRPDCGPCQACIPIRIPVHRFQPRRSHRRSWDRLSKTTRVLIRPARFDAEYFELYCRYIETRHPGSEMGSPTPDDFTRFLISPWGDTLFLEVRQGDELLSVAVTDLLPSGLSAVYTFFDPARASESPGVYSILLQIEEARRLQLEWLYLGFWIPGCQKMEYKQEYRPLQLLSRGVWREFSAKESISLPEELAFSPDETPLQE
jgi:arginine-tRNA-protein transferase